MSLTETSIRTAAVPFNGPIGISFFWRSTARNVYLVSGPIGALESALVGGSMPLSVDLPGAGATAGCVEEVVLPAWAEARPRPPSESFDMGRRIGRPVTRLR